MTSVHVRLFGRYRELADRPEVEVELGQAASVADLVAALHALPLEGLPPRPVVAVNHRPAADSDRVTGDDEIALIPPVAGG